MPKTQKALVYAVRKGRKPGLYHSWDDCAKQVHRYPSAQFKGFRTVEEARHYLHDIDTTSSDARPTSASSPTSIFIETATNAAAKLPWAEPRRKRVADVSEDSDRTALAADGRTKQRRTDTLTNMTVVLHGNDALEGDQSDNLKALSEKIKSPDEIIVYTDGSSHGNGKRGSIAGYGVYWADPLYHRQNVAARLPGPVQTNNRAELTAILIAIRTLPDPSRPLHIYTDSRYAIQAINKWIVQWRANNWKTSTKKDVENRDLFEAIQDAINACRYRPVLTYVRGHAGHYGNVMADKLANEGAASGT